MAATSLGTEIVEFLNEITITHERGVYRLEIINPVEYASYVEYGHRQTPGRYVPALGKSLKKSFVKGRHMLNMAEEHLKQISEPLLAKRLKEFLTGYFAT